MTSATATQIARLISERNRFRDILYDVELVEGTEDLEGCVDALEFFFTQVATSSGYSYTPTLITDDSEIIQVTDGGTVYDLDATVIIKQI